jgi:hypothetical protein
VAHSARTLLLREMLIFLDTSDGTYGGVSADEVMASAAAKNRKPATTPRTRAPAKPLYEDDEPARAVGDEDDVGEAEVLRMFGVEKEWSDDDDDFKNFMDYQSFMSSVEILSSQQAGKEDADEAAYTPSTVWFKAKTAVPPAPPAAREVHAREAISVQALQREPAGELLAPATPARRVQREAPSDVLAPVTPAQIAPWPRLPTTPGIARAGVVVGELDLSIVPDHVADATLAILHRPLQGLFVPPPPSLRSAAVSVTLDCPLCGCQYPSANALGFHCFRSHWPQPGAVTFNPTPVSFTQSSAPPPQQQQPQSQQRQLQQQQHHQRSQHQPPPQPRQPSAPATPSMGGTAPQAVHATLLPSVASPSLPSPTPQHFAVPSPKTPTTSLSISLSEPTSVRDRPGTTVQKAPAALGGAAGRSRAAAAAPLLSLAEEEERRLSGEMSYEVEAILQSKVEYGVTKYLLKWVGFSAEHCTWEPESALLPGAQSILRDFRRAQQQQQQQQQQQGGKKKKEKEKKQKSVSTKSHKRKRAVDATRFLDLEANLSGSDASSDEVWRVLYVCGCGVYVCVRICDSFVQVRCMRVWMGFSAV